MDIRAKVQRAMGRVTLALGLMLVASLGSAQELPVFQRLPPVTAGLTAPTAVAFDAVGKLYVVEASRGRLVVFDVAGSELGAVEEIGTPISVAVAPDGTILVGNRATGSVDVYAPSLERQGRLGAGVGEFGRATGIAVGSNGDIYVADGKANQICVYGADGMRRLAWPRPGYAGGPLNAPSSVALDANTGEVYVVHRPGPAETGGSAVRVYDAAGVLLRSFGPLGLGDGFLAKPVAAQIDLVGRVYVTDALQNLVQVFTGAGVFLGTVFDADHPLRTPVGAALDRPANRLVVASLNAGRVEAFRLRDDAHTVVVSHAEGGSVTPEGTVVVPDGDSVTFAIQAAPDYRSGVLRVDGAQVALQAPASYTLPAVSANHTLEVWFDPLAQEDSTPPVSDEDGVPPESPEPEVAPAAPPSPDGAGGAEESMRFQTNEDGTVTDRTADLTWLTAPACVSARSWSDALLLAQDVNAGLRPECRGEPGGWHVPNALELLSLLEPDRGEDPRVAPEGGRLRVLGLEAAPAAVVWSSTTVVETSAQGWAVDLRGGELVRSAKRESQLALLVRTSVAADGGSQRLATGQTRCFDAEGAVVPCAGTGQDGDLRQGVPRPPVRFFDNGDGTVSDAATELGWLQDVSCLSAASPDASHQTLAEFVAAPGAFACGEYRGQYRDWRLPTRTELYGLIDFSRPAPGLPAVHPFLGLGGEVPWPVAVAVANGEGTAVDRATLDGLGRSVSSLSVWPVRSGPVEPAAAPPTASAPGGGPSGADGGVCFLGVLEGRELR